MSSPWTVRGLIRVLAVLLIAALAPPVLASTPARAAVEPSVPLPETSSVAVRQDTASARAQDEASSKEIRNDQPQRAGLDGAGMPTATSLSPSATWDVSNHTGDFTWGYPLRVPPAPGGLAPNLALSYSSSTVDGRTSATNNQPSWIGDGWDLWPGYVERSYGSCADDGVQVGDLCWRSDNATAAYGGGGGRLICCDGDSRWRAERDDGARIERKSGVANGDEGIEASERGEHWRITTVDGTQYWFGSQPDANSTWTVPVFGDDAGEQCHRGSFDTSHCAQAWRWNLDKVVDRNGNVIRFYYNVERNTYGMNLKDTGVSYVRGGTLDRIEYGMNETVSGPATAKVEFTSKNRCLPGSDCRVEKPGNWPDTPLDQTCAATCANHSPTFWSTQRLDTITTRVRHGADYDPVDRWTLNQQYPDPGTEAKDRAALWLKEIRHTGLAGGTLDLPPVTFEGHQYPNRVDGDGDGYSALNRYRLTGIVSEAGGWLSVNYEPPNCKPGQPRVEDAHLNTMRCFPVKWAPKNQPPRVEYFHKYVVASIVQSDAMGTSTQQTTRYEYLDGAAWHWDTSDIVKDEDKTWSEFRGFKRVRVRGGSPDDPGGSPVSMTEERFYRGMNADRLPAGGSRAAEVVDSENRKRTDDNWLRGFGYESTTYEHEKATGAVQDDPPVVHRTITDAVVRGPTASRGPYQAHIVNVGTQRGFTAVKGSPWRITETSTEYDDRGLPVKVNALGDRAVATDDRCTRTTYHRDTGTWVLNTPSEAKSVAVECGTAPTFPRHAVSATRFGYDSRGNQTKTEVAKAWSAADPDYVTVSTSVHDVHGRVTSSTNALGRTVTVSYTPEKGGPVTGTTETSPATATLPDGLATTTTVDPASGNPTKVVDPNGRVTEIVYDALGRTAEAWLPNRPKASNSQGSVEYTYLVRRDEPSVVTTEKLGPNGIRTSSNVFFDGWLRPRQTQDPAVGGGRLLVDTRYDSQGRAYKTTQPYFNTGSVDTNLWVASDAQVPGLTRTKYDGAGRAIQSTYQTGAADEWTATTGYDGDRVHSTPPQGGTATTTLVDAHGRPTELRQYHGPGPTGAYDATRYAYAPAGQLAEVTGPDGAVWRYEYDLRGRKTRAVDPDAGASTLTYDNVDQLVSTTDAAGKTLAYDYDELGRRTELREDSLSGRILARWTYDTATFGLGLPTSAIRYTGTNSENAYTEAVGSYTALNQPLNSTVTIPPVEGKLAGTYQRNVTYGWDGTLSSETYPAVAAASVASQTVNYETDDWGRPQKTRTAGGTMLVAKTSYTRYGEVERIEQGTSGGIAWQSFYYDTHTRRLEQYIVDAELSAPMQQDVRFTYDDAGTVTSVADVTLGQQPDVQCFRHDHLRRLTDAWTGAKGDWARPDGCRNSPAMAAGAAPYWHTYEYDKGGNRAREVKRAPANTTDRSYTYPTVANGQPHTLRSVTDATGTETYGYNALGQTTSRGKAGNNQTLTWDREGRVATVAGTGGTTSFVYSANGDRLLRKDPSGTTLYLGNQEIQSAGGSVTVTRYYSHGGKVVAMNRAGILTWLAGDHQATAQLAIDANDLTVTRRRQFPFGGPRGAAVAWPGERGFVGGVQDASTGLTHLGAREYDPLIGRFISVDPLMNLADPQQMQGYSYANNSPITFSDPTGLAPCGPDGERCGLGHKADVCGGPFCGPNGKQVTSGGGSGGGTHRTGCGGRGSCAPNGTPPHTSSSPPVKKSGDLDLFGEEHTRLMACGFFCGADGPADALAVAKELSGYNDAKACSEGDGWGCFWLVLGRVPLLKLLKPADAVDNGPSPGKAADNEPGPGKPCSFSADTKVLMADGTTKPISEVRVGDKVLATDPETGEEGPRTVTHLWIHDDQLVDLGLAGGKAITTTEDHPFWNETDQQWQQAQQIEPGELLRTATGERLAVAGLNWTTSHAGSAYNLTVADIRTYYVIAGTTPVLVHNTCPDGVADVWHPGTYSSPEASFLDHYGRHNGGMTQQEYMDAAKRFANQVTSPDGARGMTVKRVPVGYHGDGYGMKYTDSSSQMIIVGPDGRIVVYDAGR
jgi:RHS repeat-associated protein